LLFIFGRVVSTPYIDIGRHRVEYSVVRGASKRYTYFRFKPDMKLEIVLPRGRNIDVESAVKSRESWILKRLEELGANSRIIGEDSVMYDGDRLAVIFLKSDEAEDIAPDTFNKTVTIRASDKSRMLELIRRWFVRETSRYVVKKLQSVSENEKIKYTRADVRQMRNWGYCTRNGRLSFSWQLIALPERLREYVIMHEVAHLKEFNHSAAFKKRLGELCKDFKERERALDRIIPGSLADYLD
jgi:predicted metal-dependent hydrolase